MVRPLAPAFWNSTLTESMYWWGVREEMGASESGEVQGEVDGRPWRGV